MNRCLLMAGWRRPISFWGSISRQTNYKALQCITVAEWLLHHSMPPPAAAALQCDAAAAVVSEMYHVSLLWWRHRCVLDARMYSAAMLMVLHHVTCRSAVQGRSMQMIDCIKTTWHATTDALSYKLRVDERYFGYGRVYIFCMRAGCVMGGIYKGVWKVYGPPPPPKKLRNDFFSQRYCKMWRLHDFWSPIYTKCPKTAVQITYFLQTIDFHNPLPPPPIIIAWNEGMDCMLYFTQTI